MTYTYRHKPDGDAHLVSYIEILHVHLLHEDTSGESRQPVEVMPIARARSQARTESGLEARLIMRSDASRH